MIIQANRLFDEVVVAIGKTLIKNFILARKKTGDTQGSNLKLNNVRITSFENQYLIDFAIQEGQDLSSEEFATVTTTP